MTERVLVIGGGGREHALSWKLSESSHVSHVFVSPGNAGSAQQNKTTNVTLDCTDFESIADWCRDNSVSLVVVGPELPLGNGIADVLSRKGVNCFGPTASAARIEVSKDFAKQFMSRHAIPTARYKTFTDATAAKEYIMSAPYDALVVKANGVASGKGVVVAETRQQACDAVVDCLENGIFGEAGSTVVIEERLEGEEVSCLAFCDGATVACMPPTQDHKRLLDGDLGPNTGGMGAYCPYPKVTADTLKFIENAILQKTVDGFKSEGIKYIGVLYAGIMLTDDGPKVLEFNCRFGDPETQVILPLLTSDLYVTCHSCVTGTLSSHLPVFDPHLKALGVVLVSQGYPGSFKKGLPITGLDTVKKVGGKVIIFHAGTAISDNGQIVTSGGRVLLSLAIQDNFSDASKLALKAASNIHFNGCFFRRDIGHSILRKDGLTYQDSGVDISAGASLVDAIKPLAQLTSRSGIVSGIGSFAASFDVKAAGYSDPILVSGTDGVGTKLKICTECGCHKTIGIDLVAMCANDILTHAAEPLFFLDYFACGHLDVSMATEVVEGIAEGCRQAGCALIGGETAEMPGMYSMSNYDLAGFIVGAVNRGEELPRLDQVQPGDVLLGLESSGLHSNGFSLVRKVVERSGLKYSDQAPFFPSQTLGNALLTPTKIYIDSVLPLLRQGRVKSVCHITGGGLIENIPRSLPKHLSVEIDASTWTVPPVFSWISQVGQITDEEMLRTFNCGIGLILIMGKDHSDEMVDKLNTSGERASIIGQVVKNDRSNLQALLDHCRSPLSMAIIALVISNKPGVKGLDRAQEAGVPIQVIKHGDFSSREEFDARLHEALIAAEIDLVCLAGFMRILSGGFVKKWEGRMLNTHPSLLPSFKGAHAHRDVIASGVKVSGCTIHFVASTERLADYPGNFTRYERFCYQKAHWMSEAKEEVDSGKIVVQETVRVEPAETVETLSEKVKRVEHEAYPKALELVASGQVALN